MKPAIMYVVPLCPYCRRAKRFLSQQGIEFETRNILTNSTYRQEFDKLTDVKTVPVTVIEGHVIVGNDEAAFKKAISELKTEDHLLNTSHM